ncbi:MAG: 3'-5' exonuclease, partial [Candidatus Cloacimonadales bacterium]|nr:3'-5' exonuclease [Candidatus Cloacimonadales bacterium]
VMRKIYKKMQIDKASYPYQKVLSIISRFKSQMIDINNFFDYYDKSKLNKLFYQIYEEYEKYLKANNAMDFDNILYYATEIFQNNPEVLEKYQKQFQYIMVDEYQDTNLVQIKFIYQLARKYKNICVVGDDDQSIYGWRGANIENILTFDEDYKNTKIVRLEQNYRSTSTILNLANNIIAHNKKRHKKQLWTQEESNVLPQLISHDNEYEEARYIAEEVLDLHSKKAMLQECVVLYRTNSQSRVLEQEFTKQQIPYVVVGGQNFYQRSEIKDMIAWLRVIANPLDNESLLRIINLPPRGLGQVAINNILNLAINNGLSAYEVLKDSRLLGKFKRQQNETLKFFVEKIEKWKLSLESDTISAVLKDIINTYDLENYYKSIDDNKEAIKYGNINEFVAAAAEFSDNYFKENKASPNVAHFLQFLSLQTDLDTAEKRANIDAIRLMTMHNAKGLEFNYVFLAGLEQGLLPHILSCDDEREIEEERRLFYVAATRARKRLFLNYAHSRRNNNSYQCTKPSEFLEELNCDLYEEVKASYWQPHAPRRQEYKPDFGKSRAIITENQKFFKIGQEIMHQEFGKGVILSVDGVGKDAKLSISFYNGNLKKISGAWVELIDD